MAQKFNQIGASATSGFLQDLANGKGLKDAFKSATSALASNISQVFADDIAQTLFKPNGPLGGFGDFFSKLLGGGKDATGSVALASSASALTASGTLLSTAGASLNAAATALITAAGFSSGSSAAGSFSSFLPGIIDAVPPEFGIPAFAGGSTYVPRTGLALVHEGERISTASQSRRAGMAQRASSPVNITINMPAGSTASPRQIAQASGDAVTRALKRR